MISRRWRFLAAPVLTCWIGCAQNRVTNPLEPCTLPIVAADQVDRPIRMIQTQEPIYPPEAVQRAHEGTVLVRATVDYDGSLCGVVVHSSSGYAELDNAALVSARCAHFTRVRQRGRPIRADVIVPIAFKLL